MAWWSPLRGPLDRLLGRAGEAAVPAGAPSPPSPAASAPAATALPTAPAWSALPVVQRVLAAPLAPVAPLGAFTSSLSAFQDPSFLGALGHQVDPRTGGMADGLADLAPGRPRAYGPAAPLAVPTDPATPAPRTVQRQLSGWPAAEAEAVRLEHPLNLTEELEAAAPAPTPRADPLPVEPEEATAPPPSPVATEAAAVLEAPGSRPEAAPEVRLDVSAATSLPVAPASSGDHGSRATPSTAVQRAVSGPPSATSWAELDPTVSAAAPGDAETAAGPPSPPLLTDQAPPIAGGTTAPPVGVPAPRPLSHSTGVPQVQRTLSTVAEPIPRAARFPEPVTRELPVSRVVESPAPQPVQAPSRAADRPAPTLDLPGAGNLPVAGPRPALPPDPRGPEEDAPVVARERAHEAPVVTRDVVDGAPVVARKVAVGTSQLPAAEVAPLLGPPPSRTPEDGDRRDDQGPHLDPPLQRSAAAGSPAPDVVRPPTLPAPDDPAAPEPASTPSGPTMPEGAAAALEPEARQVTPLPELSVLPRLTVVPGGNAPSLQRSTAAPPPLRADVGLLGTREPLLPPTTWSGPAPDPPAAVQRLTFLPPTPATPPDLVTRPSPTTATATATATATSLPAGDGGSATSVSPPAVPNLLTSPSPPPVEVVPVPAPLQRSTGSGQPAAQPRAGGRVAVPPTGELLPPHQAVPPPALQRAARSAGPVTDPPPVAPLAETAGEPEPAPAPGEPPACEVVATERFVEPAAPAPPAPPAGPSLALPPAAGTVQRLGVGGIAAAAPAAGPVPTTVAVTPGARPMPPTRIVQRQTQPVGTPPHVAPANRPLAPLPGVSFATMFAAADAAPGDGGSTTVQLAAVEGTPSAADAPPVAATVTGEPLAALPAPGPPPAAPPAAADLDEMARRLFEPLSARLRAELWLDRERAGLMTDIRP